MVTVSGNPNPTNLTTSLSTVCELDMCSTFYKNLGPPFTGMPSFYSIPWYQ